MRNTDPEPRPCIPVGEKVTQPTPSTPDWKPKPGSPGIEQNAQGELRTNIPENNKGFP